MTTLNRLSAAVSSLLALASCSSTGVGLEPVGPPPTATVAAEGLASVAPASAAHRPSASEDMHHDHHHHAALFLGWSSQDGGEDAFTIGADYEYKLAKQIGIGAIVDYAGGDLESLIIAPALYFHPMENLTLLLASGEEFEHGDDQHSVLRVGANYAVHVGDKYSVAPTFNVDFVGGHEVYLFGVSVGVGF